MNIDGLNLDYNLDNMNIQQSDISQNDINDELSNCIDKNANENQKFDDYLNLQEDKQTPQTKKIQKDEDLKDADILPNIPGQIEANYIKNLQDFAAKDKLSSKTKVNFDKIHSHSIGDKSETKSYNLDSMSDKDFKLLINGLQDKNTVIQGINNPTGQNHQLNCSVTNQAGQISYKSIDVSKGVANLIEKAYKTQMPVRLDFEGNSSVILRIAADGKLSAEFQSSNKAMEDILKNSIPSLRNRLDAEGITYKAVFFKDTPKRQNKRDQNGG